MITYTTVDAFKQCYFEDHTMLGASTHDRYTMSSEAEYVVIRNGEGELVKTPKDLHWIREQDIPLEGTYVYSHAHRKHLEITDTHYDKDIFFIFMHALTHDDVNYPISLYEFITHAEDFRDVSREDIRFLKHNRTPGVYDPRDLLVNTVSGKVHTRAEMSGDLNPEIVKVACFAENRLDDTKAPDLSYLDRHRKENR